MSADRVSGAAHFRTRALRAARTLALWLVVVASATGCSAIPDAYCNVFTGTRYCCERTGSSWDTATRVCHPVLVLPSS